MLGKYNKPPSFDATIGQLPIIDPRLSHFLEYWLELRSESRIPKRREFDPLRTVRLLPYFWIIERDNITRRYRLSLAGEQTLQLIGRPTSGTYIDDIFDDHARYFTELLNTITLAPAIHHSVGDTYRSNGMNIFTERLALPLIGKNDTATVDTVFGATVFNWDDAAIEQHARYIGAESNTTIVLGDSLAG